MRNFPLNGIENEWNILELEYCDFNCADFIKNVSQCGPFEMELLLDIFFFQIAYTLVTTQKVFPYFIHNDLFMRNILGISEKDQSNHYTYQIDDVTYYVPQKVFFPKINDFGLTNLNKEFKADRKVYKSNVRDWWNIVFDVYHGGDLGGESLITLSKNDPDKMKVIKKYFMTYFDVVTVDLFKEKSPKNMNWDWSNAMDADFLKEIKLKEPEVLLKEYFVKAFGKINQNASSFK